MAGYDHGPWNGLLAPAKTPKPIVNRLSAEASRIVQLPEVKGAFTSEGADPVGSSPEAFAAIVRTETAKWAKVIKAAGIKVE